MQAGSASLRSRVAGRVRHLPEAGSLSIALVHERFTEVAGSEKVVEQLALEFPGSRVLAPISRPSGTPAGIERAPETSGLQRPYERLGTYTPLLPLLPGAFRRMDLTGAEVVVASHHAFATQVVHATEAPVVAYVHSPARWAWDAALRAGEAGNWVGRVALDGLSARTRRQELAAAPRLAGVVANSAAVRARVQEWWGRDAVVVHPPVDTEFYYPDPAVEREDFVLVAGRLVPYKRPDLAVQAAAKAGVRVVVAGDGRGLETCRAVAGAGATFVGRVDDDELRDLFRRCRAVLVPGVEDFGITPVEAMACGAPVVTVADGGGLDHTVPGVSGWHVPAGSDAELIDGFAVAIDEVGRHPVDPSGVRRHAEQFSRATFRSRMRDEVARALR